MRGVVVAVLAVLLTACGTDDDAVERIGEQVVAEWQRQPEVAEASYEYSSGLDYQQYLRLKAVVRTDSDEVVERLRDIAKREYWRGTGRKVSFRVAIHSSDGRELRAGEIRFRLGDQFELEQKYGARPEVTR